MAMLLKENVRFKLIFLSIPIFLIFLRFSIFKLYGLELDLSQDFDFSNATDIKNYLKYCLNLFFSKII